MTGRLVLPRLLPPRAGRGPGRPRPTSGGRGGGGRHTPGVQRVEGR